MEKDQLPNELDRKHAEREEKRNRAATYRRKRGWRWLEGWWETCNKLQERERYDRFNEQEFQGRK